MFEEILQKGKKRAFSARPRDAHLNTRPRRFPSRLSGQPLGAALICSSESRQLLQTPRSRLGPTLFYRGVCILVR